MCSEGKDRCSCSLLKMPTRLTSLPLSSTRRVDSRGNSEAHSSSKPHSVVPLKTYREKRMAQGGERKGQSLRYSDDSPQRNVHHFSDFFPAQSPTHTKLRGNMETESYPSPKSKKVMHKTLIAKTSMTSRGTEHMSRLGVDIKIPSKSSR